jgi:hypothetical protein
MNRFMVGMVVALLAGACDPGPSGPGDLNGSLESVGAPLGGAVLEVVGKGIQGFSSSGGTRVFWAATGSPDTYRVVLINGSPGTLDFRVAVEALERKKPSAAVINVVSEGNLPLPATTDYRVRFSRK